MKILLLAAATMGMLLTLPGCHHRAGAVALQPEKTAAFVPMQQSWRGVLPCADCEGIETSLFLEKDGTWIMNERYQGVRSEPSSFASYGVWARTADTLVLTDSKGEKAYYRAKGDKLEMMDREGKPIVSTLNYILEPVKASLPLTPMPMRGMYFYMADAAIFTDCASGKRVSVAHNAQLERAYSAVKGSDMKPVLLVADGHFTLEENPDTGENVKTLFVDKNAKFIPDKDCR